MNQRTTLTEQKITTIEELIRFLQHNAVGLIELPIFFNEYGETIDRVRIVQTTHDDDDEPRLTLHFVTEE